MVKARKSFEVGTSLYYRRTDGSWGRNVPRPNQEAVINSFSTPLVTIPLPAFRPQVKLTTIAGDIGPIYAPRGNEEGSLGIGSSAADKPACQPEQASRTGREIGNPEVGNVARRYSMEELKVIGREIIRNNPASQKQELHVGSRPKISGQKFVMGKFTLEQLRNVGEWGFWEKLACDEKKGSSIGDEFGGPNQKPRARKHSIEELKIVGRDGVYELGRMGLWNPSSTVVSSDSRAGLTDASEVPSPMSTSDSGSSEESWISEPTATKVDEESKETSTLLQEFESRVQLVTARHESDKIQINALSGRLQAAEAQLQHTKLTYNQTLMAAKYEMGRQLTETNTVLVSSLNELYQKNLASMKICMDQDLQAADEKRLAQLAAVEKRIRKCDEDWAAERERLMKARDEMEMVKNASEREKKWLERRLEESHTESERARRDIQNASSQQLALMQLNYTMKLENVRLARDLQAAKEQVGTSVAGIA